MCPAEYIYISLPAYNVAGYLSTGDVCYAESMRKFLELKEEDECLGFFQLGVAKSGKTDKKRPRIPAKEKTVWINK